MQENKTNVKEIISLILACLSIICCCVWYAGMLLGLAAVILGILAIRDNTVKSGDIAIAGIVVGGVGFALGAAVAIILMLVYSGVAAGVTSASVGTTLMF